MNCTVTPAGDDHAAELLTLATRAFAELTAERGGELLLATHPFMQEASLSSRLAAGEIGGFLGAIDGAVVGGALVRLRESQLGPLGEISLLYVEPAAREVGLGETLLEATLGWCRERGALGLDVPALPGTRAAKSFLEEMGFRARLLVMHRPLDPHGS